MRRLWIWIVALVLALAGGCAGVGPRHDQWPSGAPPRAYFESVYRADDANQRRQSRHAYLTWVERFYEGWILFPSGWNDVEERLLASVDEERQPIVEGKLQELGRLVAGEWAKDDQVRRIHSGMLRVWGGVIRETSRHDKQERTIDQVTEDVRGLLSGELEARAIQQERYWKRLVPGAAPLEAIRTQTPMKPLGLSDPYADEAGPRGGTREPRSGAAGGVGPGYARQ